MGGAAAGASLEEAMPLHRRLAVSSLALAALLLAWDAARHAAGAVSPSASPAFAAAADQPALDAAAAPQPEAPSLELQPGVVLRITELRKMPDKGVMQLKFTVTNGTDTDTSLMNLGLAGFHQLEDISVIDFAGRKEYGIGKGGSSCLCSTFSGNSGGVVRSGETREFWAWYALPQGGARKMAVRMRGHQPIMDVPVQ
jgi:hypothetical protein